MTALPDPPESFDLSDRVAIVTGGSRRAAAVIRDAGGSGLRGLSGADPLHRSSAAPRIWRPRSRRAGLSLVSGQDSISRRAQVAHS